MTADEIRSMEAGPEMDRLVAEKVMGWAYWDCLGDEPEGVYFYDDCVGSVGVCEPTESPDDTWDRSWRPSTSIADAWEVVEKIGRVTISSPKAPIAAEYENCDEWGAEHCPLGVHHYSPVMGWAPTAPLVICRVALLAVGE